jgi:hypothetical protein
MDRGICWRGLWESVQPLGEAKAAGGACDRHEPAGRVALERASELTPTSVLMAEMSSLHGEARPTSPPLGANVVLGLADGELRSSSEKANIKELVTIVLEEYWAWRWPAAYG